MILSLIGHYCVHEPDEIDEDDSDYGERFDSVRDCVEEHHVYLGIVEDTG